MIYVNRGSKANICNGEKRGCSKILSFLEAKRSAEDEKPGRNRRHENLELQIHSFNNKLSYSLLYGFIKVHKLFLSTRDIPQCFPCRSL